MENNLYNTMYNPDVLSCIANLSNDEVFTPPEVANAMLDLLPQELFSDPNTITVIKNANISNIHAKMSTTTLSTFFIFYSAFLVLR